MSNFVDTESHFGKSKEPLTFQLIVLKHLDNISKLASREMRGGFWQKKAIPMASGILTSEEYVPDSRAEYCQAIFHLHDLLMPFFDMQMKKAADEINHILDELTDPDLKLKKTRTLFQNLSLFMNRNGYLQSKDITLDDVPDDEPGPENPEEEEANE